MKTGLQFEQEFYSGVVGKLPIKGKYYRDGLRPPDNVNTSEDCIVIFKAGIDGDIQRGYITINIYVPNITYNGRKIKDIGRCEFLESALNTFAENLFIPEYKIEREGTIKTYNVYDTEEHFVSLEIKYNYATF